MPEAVSAKRPRPFSLCRPNELLRRSGCSRVGLGVRIRTSRHPGRADKSPSDGCSARCVNRDSWMTSLLAILALGFMLGMRHATDPDHVVAVTTIVSGQRSVKRAALIGAAWGIGHTLTILLVGSGIILFKWAIPARVGLAMELAVALMLIVLGVASLTGTVRWMRRTARLRAGQVHSHPHLHGDYVHTHPHGHAPESHPHAEDETPLARIDRHLGRIGSYRLARPLIVGVVHGLAGSAAVALLV